MSPQFRLNHGRGGEPVRMAADESMPVTRSPARTSGMASTQFRAPARAPDPPPASRRSTSDAPAILGDTRRTSRRTRRMVSSYPMLARFPPDSWDIGPAVVNVAQDQIRGAGCLGIASGLLGDDTDATRAMTAVMMPSWPTVRRPIGVASACKRGARSTTRGTRWRRSGLLGVAAAPRTTTIVASLLDQQSPCARRCEQPLRCSRIRWLPEAVHGRR